MSLVLSAHVSSGCNEYFKRSLFFMGEFGGNDYTFILAAGKTVKRVMSYVPKVVEAISAGVEVAQLLHARDTHTLLIN